MGSGGGGPVSPHNFAYNSPKVSQDFLESRNHTLRPSGKMQVAVSIQLRFFLLQSM